MTKSRLNIELKTPPEALLADFDDYYNRESIIDVVTQFIDGNKSAELQIWVRLRYLNASDREKLENWAYEKYGFYVNNNSSALSTRENTWLGIMCERGIGVPKDLKKAKTCYQKSKQEGDTMAMFLFESTAENPNLEQLLKSKDKCPIILDILIFLLQKTQPEETMKYYEKAVHCNLGMSIRNLGKCYLLGEGGVPLDNKKAYDYFVLAARLGVAEALSDLGVMFYEGLYVDSNKPFAKKLFEKSLERFSNPYSYFYLANLCQEDNNTNEAAKNFRYAAEAGFKKAEEFLWNLFKAKKNQPEIIYQAGIGLQNSEDEKQKNETRNAFNELFRTQPDLFYQLIDDSLDNLNDLKSLIDIHSIEAERWHETCETLTSLGISHNLTETVLEYEHPFPSKIKEKTFDNRNRLFTSKNHKAIQKNESKISCVIL